MPAAVERPPEEQRRLARWVGAGTIASALLLVGFIADSAAVGRGLAELRSPDAVPIELVGHQWWWEVTYPGRTPSELLTTANELHVPVGRPVELRLTSRDVIHSFWVPAFGGKRDLVPGRTNVMTLQVDRPGTYRGQCAEFCGYQHAKMQLTVVAEAPDDFARWRAHQLERAPEPETARARHGRDVFVAGPCALCHRVRGTMALATSGPDLTHVASRTTVGAGALPHTRGGLAGWIVDPQGIKPGCNMPGIVLPGADLDALLDYLEGLR